MKSIPVLRSSDLTRSLAFYTDILEFKEKYPQHRELSLGKGVMFLVCDAAELQLSIHRGDGEFGASVILELDSPREVDEHFARFTARGLDQSHRTESPVHLAPLDQTWGAHVFCVDDPDGNTLSFSAWH